MILASEMVLPLSITAIFTTSGSHDSRHAQQVESLYSIYIYVYFLCLSAADGFALPLIYFLFHSPLVQGVEGAVEEALP